MSYCPHCHDKVESWELMSESEMGRILNERDFETAAESQYLPRMRKPALRTEQYTGRDVFEFHVLELDHGQLEHEHRVLSFCAADAVKFCDGAVCLNDAGARVFGRAAA